MKIGIISGSVREGRNATQVTEWIYNYAINRNDVGVEYEVVDLADYPLPLLGQKVPAEYEETANQTIQEWSEKMASFDAYVFVTPEYNHAVGGALKNAIDYLKAEVANKPAALVGYGSLGGARAHENMRIILAELRVPTVRTTVNFSLLADFENFSVFKLHDYHATNAEGMFTDLLEWANIFSAVGVKN